MRTRAAVLLTATLGVLGGCADDDLGTGYLSFDEDLLLCDDRPDPETGRCEAITFGVEKFLVLNVSQIATATAGDRTVSLEPVRLRQWEDIGYEARPIDG